MVVFQIKFNFWGTYGKICQFNFSSVLFSPYLCTRMCVSHTYTYISIYVCMCVHVYMCVCFSYLSIYLSIYLCVYECIYAYGCECFCISIYLWVFFVCVCVCLLDSNVFFASRISLNFSYEVKRKCVFLKKCLIVRFPYVNFISSLASEMTLSTEKYKEKQKKYYSYITATQEKKK